MNILVAVGDTDERERLLAVLDGHFACCARVGDEPLRTALLRARSTIAIVDRGELSVVTSVVPAIQSIVLLGEHPAPGDFSAAFAAGADDVLRAGACKEEVWGRVANTARMRLRTTPLPTLTMRIGEVKVWKDIERIVAIELGELLGTPLRLAEGAHRPLVHTSVIPLTLVSDHLLVQLGIGVDERTRDQLVERLLDGDCSSDAVRDVLREMANTAGGAIRRAALDDGVSFSIGLPSNENLFGGSSKQRVWTISDDQGLQLDCTVALSANQPLRIHATELREGMVLARDLVGVDGSVVIAGTSLTITTAEQIRHVASDREIEIEAAFGIS